MSTFDFFKMFFTVVFAVSLACLVIIAAVWALDRKFGFLSHPGATGAQGKTKGSGEAKKPIYFWFMYEGKRMYAFTYNLPEKFVYINTRTGTVQTKRPSVIDPTKYIEVDAHQYKKEPAQTTIEKCLNNFIY